MSAQLEQLIHALLYEGYALYPYRPSSQKNQRERFTFGRVYPESYSTAQPGAEPCVMQTECLVQAPEGNRVEMRVNVRFLQPTVREIGRLANPVEQWDGAAGLDYKLVPELEVNGERFSGWLEASERRIELPGVSLALAGSESEPTQFHAVHEFVVESARTLEPLRDERGWIAGLLIRRQEALRGRVEMTATPLNQTLCRVRVRITNQTNLPKAERSHSDEVLPWVFTSTHTVLQADRGQFVSLMDPPDSLQSMAAACQNLGTWPVLVGDEANAQRDTLLSSPIILYDYPQLAPESPHALCDATEIDEILTLRILTMTDEEKREMARTDAYTRQLLERTEALPGAAILKMHGTLREPVRDRAGQVEFDDFFGANVKLSQVSLGDAQVRPGDRVRIRAKARADVMDLALNGQTAVVEGIEEDVERRIYLSVVFESDPGKDLGLLRQPGHRFFYGLDEVELVRELPVLQAEPEA